MQTTKVRRSVRVCALPMRSFRITLFALCTSSVTAKTAAQMNTPCLVRCAATPYLYTGSPLRLTIPSHQGALASIVVLPNYWQDLDVSHDLQACRGCEPLTSSWFHCSQNATAPCQLTLPSTGMSKVESIMQLVVVPAARAHLPDLEVDSQPTEVYVSVYDAVGGKPRLTPLHVDNERHEGVVLTAIIELSDEADYQGGGTFYQTAHDTNHTKAHHTKASGGYRTASGVVLRMPRGTLLLHKDVVHAAHPTTHGTRALLVAHFVAGNNRVKSEPGTSNNHPRGPALQVAPLPSSTFDSLLSCSLPEHDSLCDATFVSPAARDSRPFVPTRGLPSPPAPTTIGGTGGASGGRASFPLFCAEVLRTKRSVAWPENGIQQLTEGGVVDFREFDAVARNFSESIGRSQGGNSVGISVSVLDAFGSQIHRVEHAGDSWSSKLVQPVHSFGKAVTAVVFLKVLGKVGLDVPLWVSLPDIFVREPAESM